MCNTICINDIKKHIGHVENLSQHFLPHLNFLGPNFPSRFRFNITHSPRQSDESVLKMTSSELGVFTFFQIPDQDEDISDYFVPGSYFHSQVG